MTRTIWLLANCAKAFPVECANKENSMLLYQHAGAYQSRLLTVSELILSKYSDLVYIVEMGLFDGWNISPVPYCSR